MQGCHANFYLDRISLGIIQDLALMAHPAFPWPDFLFQFNKINSKTQNHIPTELQCIKAEMIEFKKTATVCANAQK
ncbi:hypothetical protein BIT28_26375 [Photobacterium proteolyticum]|uniref:Uncharacterized protein n=1 Tax=Photobacterium proteolyticum TaxID=1903952 RepID=A0A1Q9GUK9_9GAMM|nr:hypothetical protein BIT28_26375 [Photobacterium proteolyticum]